MIEKVDFGREREEERLKFYCYPFPSQGSEEGQIVSIATEIVQTFYINKILITFLSFIESNTK